jgi:hypothetical protein
MILHLLKTDWQRLKRPVLAVWLLLVLTTLPWLLHRPDSFAGPWAEISSRQGELPAELLETTRFRLDAELVRYLIAFATLLLSAAIGMHGIHWQAVSPLRPWKRVAAKLLSLLALLVGPQVLLGALVLQLHAFSPGVILAASLGTAVSLLLLHASSALFAYHCASRWVWLAAVTSLVAAMFVLTPMFSLGHEPLLNPFIDPWAMYRGPRFWLLGAIAILALTVLPKVFRTRPGSVLAATAAVLSIVVAAIASRRAPHIAVFPTAAASTDPALAAITPELVPRSLRIDDGFFGTRPAGSLRVDASLQTAGTLPPGQFIVWSSQPPASALESRNWTRDFPNFASPTDRAAMEAVLPAPLMRDEWSTSQNNVSQTFQGRHADDRSALKLQVSGHLFRYEILADLPLGDRTDATVDGDIRIFTRGLTLPGAPCLIDAVVQGPALGIGRDARMLTLNPHAVGSYRFVLHLPQDQLCLPLVAQVDQAAPIPSGAAWARQILKPRDEAKVRNFRWDSARLIILKHRDLGHIEREFPVDPAGDEARSSDSDWILSRNYGLRFDAYLKNHRPNRPDPATCSEAEFARYLRTISGTFFDELAVRDLAEYAPRFSHLLASHAERRPAPQAIAIGLPEAGRDALLKSIREDPAKVARLGSVLLERGWHGEVRDLLVTSLQQRRAGDDNDRGHRYDIAEAVARLEDPTTYPQLLSFLESSRSFEFYRTVRELPGIDGLLDETIAKISVQLSPAAELASLRPGRIYGVFDAFRVPVSHGNPVALAKLLDLWRSLPEEIPFFSEIDTFTKFFEPQPPIPDTLDAWRAFIDGKSAKDFTHDPLTGKWLAPSQP